MKIGDFVKMRTTPARNPWDHIGVVVEKTDRGLVCVHWNNRYTWVGSSQLELIK